MTAKLTGALTLLALLLVAFVAATSLESGKPKEQGEVALASTCDLPNTDGNTGDWLKEVKLMNYSPTSQAQTNMWMNWHPDVLNRDFGRIAALHANTVRLFIYTPVAGYPEVSKASKQKLSQAIDIAAKHCLRVQLTLFAFFSRYSDVDGSEHWAKSLLSEYAGDQRIAFVELQNELDSSNSQAMDWALRLAPYVRTLVKRPVTLSVAASQGLPGLEHLRAVNPDLDFYDLHYYGKPELAFAAMHGAKDVVSPLPLFIGEAGYSSLQRQDPGYDMGWWESYQAYYLRSVNAAARMLDLPPPAPWTFTDYESGAFPKGSKSGAEASEYDYGLVRTDGSAKPAAQAIDAIFSGSTIDAMTNGSFEWGDEVPHCWLLWQKQSADVALDGAVAHTGRASVRLSNTSSSASGLPSVYQTPIASIEPERSYTATAWALGRVASGSNRIALAWFDANSQFISTAVSEPLPLGRDEWLQLKVDSVAPLGAAFVQIHLISADNTGSVWFDDVTFE